MYEFCSYASSQGHRRGGPFEGYVCVYFHELSGASGQASALEAIALRLFQPCHSPGPRAADVVVFVVDRPLGGITGPETVVRAPAHVIQQCTAGLTKKESTLAGCQTVFSRATNIVNKVMG